MQAAAFLKNRQWSAFYKWTFYEVLVGKRYWTYRRTALLWPQANGEKERQKTAVSWSSCVSLKQRVATRNQRWITSQWCIAVLHILLLGLARQMYYLEDVSGPNYPISKSSASKMRFEIATVREKQRERCIQNAKGMHVKVRFEKVIRCYWGRRKRTNCQRNTYSLPLQNVTHVKKYIERDYNVLSDTSKSTDASEAQRATQSLSNQESRETVNVSSERASEDGPFEYTRSDDATIEQRDSVTLRPTRVKRLPSKFQGYVLGFIQLDSEQNFEA